MSRLFVLVLCCIAFAVSAQPAETRRILILLDGSGSMLETWKETTKWEVAKRLIDKTLDSIQRENPSVEIGLRVFGHQSPRLMQDCEDSKLEVPIGKNSVPAIQSKLDEIVPKGHTPIAYSLFLAAGDFPDLPGTNSIILITDGIENCEGDPCASAEVLANKRITLKPFIIGIGLAETDKGKFDCVGTYYDATDEATFENAINVVISQALNNTTLQINLVDAFGKPTETNVEMTLYDAYSGEVRYNFIHSIHANLEPDTLQIDPIGKYNLVVHTTPPVEKDNIELNPGKHNIIGLDAPQGTLVLEETGNVGFSEKQCVIRDTASGDIIYVQNLNTSQKYIAGTYDLEVLTLPRVQFNNYAIRPGANNKIVIQKSGILSINAKENFIFSIYHQVGNDLVQIYAGSLQKSNTDIEIQPGDYLVVYRSNTRKSTLNTVQVNVNIRTNRTTSLTLQ